MKPFTGKLGEFKMSGAGLGKLETGGLGQMKENLPPGNPFADIEYTDDPEENALLELEAYLRVIDGESDRGARYPKKMEGLSITPFYLPVVFRDREEKLAFFAEFGVSVAKVGDKYVDGEKLSRELLK